MKARFVARRSYVSSISTRTALSIPNSRCAVRWRLRAIPSSTRIGSFTVFDLTGQKLSRSTVLHLPELDFRFLHFSVAGPLKPESITGLSVERLPASQPEYQTVAESAQVTQKGRSSVLEFTVPAHLPVDRIAFLPGASPALFSRDVSIKVAPLPPARRVGGS